MADSDNSRTLSTVTRGDFYSFVAASLPTSQELARATRLPPDACDADPALAVWHQWCAARQRLSESSLLQQRLERSLFSVVLPPPLEQQAPRPRHEVATIFHKRRRTLATNPLRHRRPPDDRHRLCCEPPVYARTPIRASRRLDGNGSPGHVIPGAPPT